MSGWKPAKGGRPCPSCGKPDWCAWSPDGGLLRCMRAGNTPAGMRRVKADADGGTLYAYLDENQNPRPHHHNPKPPAPRKPKTFSTAAAAIEALESRHDQCSGQWTYHNAAGQPVGVVVRFDTADGGKTIRPVSRQAPASTGGTVTPGGSGGGGGWVMAGMAVPRPLYGLPALAEASQVFVCEGEKTADAAKRLGLVATTSAHGCKAASKTDWSPLAGKQVVVLPDHDDAGEGYARDVAELLHQLNPPASVRIVRLVEHFPDLPRGGDLADVLPASSDKCEHDNLRAVVQTLADDARVWEPGAPAARTLHEQSVVPKPLPDDLPPVPAFDLGMLPATLRPWVADIAERMQCPADFPAVAAMVALASVVGRKVTIRPKRHDDWKVVPNLWGAIIGRPSAMKSPPLAEVLKVLQHLEIESKRAYDNEKTEYDANQMVRDAQRKHAKTAITAAVRDGKDARSIAREAVTDDSPQPVRRRYIVNDSTVEMLGVLLNQNPNGFAITRDELIGLLKSLDKDGQEGARAFYLEAWNGNQRYTYDRIGRGTLDIEACCVSIIGGIQPGPLGAYLRDAVKGGKGDDGLMQRFQLAVWPDTHTDWENVDRWPDAHAKETAWQTYQRLDAATANDFDATVKDDHDLPHLRFDHDAQELFDHWRADLEHRLRRDDLAPALEAALGKYRSLVPSLALLIQLADAPRQGCVEAFAVNQALQWATYLEAHAHRIYASVTLPEVKAARSLLEKFQANDLTQPFTLRVLYRKHWAGLASRGDAQAAVDLLLDYDWLTEHVDHDTGGRPQNTYTLNPLVAKSATRGV